MSFLWESVRKFIDTFFPLRLLFAHLKYNIIALFYWVLLFGIVAEKFGLNFGVPYLFLSPEYDGNISWLSFLLVGFGVGGFTIAFNIYSYMIMGRIFPFISTLSRPFYKFCLNNSFLPVLFCIVYIFKMASFQMSEELASGTDVLLYGIAFLTGFIAFIALSFLYFFPTNRDLVRLLGESLGMEEQPVSSFFHKHGKWSRIHKKNNKKYIYFNSFFSLRLSRPVMHYDRDLLEKIFAHNYINATFFEIATLIAFFLIGFLKESPIFEVPAGMSIVLLLTVILMLFSIFSSWFRKWRYPFLILLFFGLNWLSKETPFFRFNTYAYGMDYSKNNRVRYSSLTIRTKIEQANMQNKSRQNAVDILTNWKQKTGEEKPKLILVMTSGGGSRSAAWTFEVLNYLDSISHGKFERHLHLITGASGGMVGASYFRSLQLEQQLRPNFHWNTALFRRNITNDLLNNLALSASVNDLFFRIAKFKYDGKHYTKDRGYAFEYQLNKNTGGILDHPLSYFKAYEQQADIPLIIFSPTIVNDGRSLLISSQSLSFIDAPKTTFAQSESFGSIDAHTFFEKNGIDNLRFTTAIRMNATFPYILPMTSLPTSPEIDVMDAGYRDNYGYHVGLEYLYEMRDWIRENTSGVIVVQIRDRKKVLINEQANEIRLLGKLSTPLTFLLNNFPRIQDYDMDEEMKFVKSSFDFPLDFVTFNLKEALTTNVSLSWHLTKNEKQTIRRAIYSAYNLDEFHHFLELMNGNEQE